jgi:pimeloyl-ACP methyl ester carboxylesterase
MYDAEFMQLATPDGLWLPGLFFEADNSKKAAIYLHGNGSSSVFYGSEYTLPKTLKEKGISLLMFNNRGAHIIKKLTVKTGALEERKLYGTAYEKIRECVEDIDGAVEFLRSRGYIEFYLIGKSTGANKICVYDHYKKNNPIEKYVIVSGGDDTGIYYNSLGQDKFWKILADAKSQVKQGDGGDIIKELLPDPLFSYQGFEDIADPDGDYNVFPYYEVFNNVKLSTKPLFRYFKGIKKESIVIYGSIDEAAWGVADQAIEILKKYQPSFTYSVIEGADHRFTDREEELDAVISTWLTT